MPLIHYYISVCSFYAVESAGGKAVHIGEVGGAVQISKLSIGAIGNIDLIGSGVGDGRPLQDNVFRAVADADYWRGKALQLCNINGQGAAAASA